MTGKHHPVRSLVVPLAIVLLGLSAFEYYDQGVVTWYRDPFSALQKLSLRVETLWRNQQQEAPFIIERSEPAEGTLGAPVDPGLNRNYIDPGEPRFELVGQVSRVIDGDSVEVRVNGRDWTVRLFGIDTPERNQPHGDQASRALTSKLDRRLVFVVIEDIDGYGRLVGTIYYKGENINRAMVAEGHAWWYREYASSEKQLEEAERAARESGLGLWGDSDPVAPWEWRRAN